MGWLDENKNREYWGVKERFYRVHWNQFLVFHQNSQKDMLSNVSQVCKKPKGSQQ